MTEEQIAIVDRLIEAAEPFTSRDILDEVPGAMVPLMEELEFAFEAAEMMLKEVEAAKEGGPT